MMMIRTLRSLERWRKGQVSAGQEEEKISVQMRIISLNMRRWGGAEKRRRLKIKVSSGNFDVCLLQETKRGALTKKMVASIWGRGDFDFLSKDADGQSGGLLCVWVRGLFDVQSTVIGEHFTCVSTKFHDTTCHLINVYSACSIAGKRHLGMICAV